jgi:hypothetical protein
MPVDPVWSSVGWTSDYRESLGECAPVQSYDYSRAYGVPKHLPPQGPGPLFNGTKFTRHDDDCQQLLANGLTHPLTSLGVVVSGQKKYISLAFFLGI